MPARNISLAAEKAARESGHEFRLAAVLFRGGNIIRVSTATKQYIGYRQDVFQFEPTRHAEVAAMHNLSKEVLPGCSMFVLRLNRNGDVTCAKPCKACISAIKKAGISKLFYTTYTGSVKKVNPQKIDIDHWKKDIPEREYFE